MRISTHRKRYTIALPQGSKIFLAKKGEYKGRMVAKFQRRGEIVIAPLTKVGKRVLMLSSHWYIAFYDKREIHREVKGYTDKEATNRAKYFIANLLSNIPIDKEVQKWFEELSDDIQTELIECGLWSQQHSASRKPLSEHISDFETSLKARGRTEKHIRAQGTILRKMFIDRKFQNWSDITGIAIDRYLIKLKGLALGKCTRNRHLQAVKEFCNWMVWEGRAAMSPVGHLRNEKMLDADRKKVRRVLAPEQLRVLLEVTAQQPARFGLTGCERSLLYRLAIETGLRANQLRTLQVKDCDFDNRQITVRDNTAKGAKTRHQPLKRKTALELQQYVSNKLPETTALYVTDKTAEMLRADLAAAGIEYTVDEQDFDFHALRHEHASLLSEGRNVSPQTVQQSMGHSSMALTYGVYVHPSDEPLRQAIETMPDLTKPSEKSSQQTATGTGSKNQ